MKIRSVLFAFLILILGCGEEEKFVPQYQVPDTLVPYVDTFIKEAAARGFNYTIENLIIRFDDTMDASVCGKCNDASTNAKVQKIISLRSGFPCWSHKLELEALLFHELGHCFLARQHLSELLPNGDPKSIMIAGNQALYSPCVYDVDASDCDKLYKREYYLDELFDINAPVPDWAK